MTDKKRLSYNKDLLDYVIQRDKAILITEYNDKIKRESYIKFICSCGIEHEKCFRTLYENGSTCKICTKNNKIIKSKNTCIKNFNVSHPMKCEKIKEKLKNVFIEKLGTDNPSKNDSIKQKKIETCIKNFGVDNPSKNDSIKQKKIETCIKNFGVSHGAKCDKVKNKIKETCIKNFGVSHPAKTKEFWKKIKETCMKKFGVSHPSKTKEFWKKFKNTCMKNLGVEYPSQSIVVQKKKQETSYSFKEYICPSGNKIKIQGYEKYALDLLFDFLEEEQVITDRLKIPSIKYEYKEKYHYYFPDIYIPDFNKIIEVKSDFTFLYDLDVNHIKMQATKNEGYNYEIWIFNKKGKLIQIYS
jgi:hypothetical protein